MNSDFKKFGYRCKSVLTFYCPDQKGLSVICSHFLGFELFDHPFGCEGLVLC